MPIRYANKTIFRHMLPRWALALAACALCACAIVSPGERAVKRTLGRLGETVYEPGPVFFNPFVTTVVRLPVQTRNLEVRLSLPSREGLTVRAEISILYRIVPEFVPAILEEVGKDYESSLILSTFRSAAADVSARHMAKEMHSSERAAIEQEVTQSMNALLSKWGFEVERVLLKSILLPQRLATAIENKLEAEQQAQQMKFVLEREELEAKRRLTEAKGIRDSQRIITEAVNPLLLKWRTIEAFRELADSPNTKIIITDGESPLLLPDIADGLNSFPTPDATSSPDATTHSQ